MKQYPQSLIDALKEIRQAYLSAQKPLPAGSNLHDALRGWKALDVPGIGKKSYKCPTMPSDNPKLLCAVMEIFPSDYAGERQPGMPGKGKYIWLPDYNQNGVVRMTSKNELVPASSKGNFDKPKSVNTIYYGPPGTGKTYTVREILKTHFPESYKAVTFHQSYSYEDFVEGIRPVLDSDTIKYTIRPGIFKALCEKAKDNPNESYALLIDEINRGNISKIFGELITLIEENKRLGAGKEEMAVTLPYSGEEFGIPSNLYIIGTMNTADRSLALLDTALRRRFAFVHVEPKPEALKDKTISGIHLEALLETINTRIAQLYDKEHCIGHAYFLGIDTIDALAECFENKIIPLLEEYFFEDQEKINHVLGGAPFFTEVTVDSYLRKLCDAGTLPELSVRWELDDKTLKNPEYYKHIYQKP